MIIELFKSYFSYWMCFLVMCIGLYAILCKQNLLKKVIGLTIFQSSIILFYILMAYKEGATVPIASEFYTQQDPLGYINPLPHALMLTAIVVGVATVGVALSLLMRVYRDFGTIDEEPLWKELGK
jgi:multicomponent Na+:H+ antiporter subunit C